MGLQKPILRKCQRHIENNNRGVLATLANEKCIILIFLAVIPGAVGAWIGPALEGPLMLKIFGNRGPLISAWGGVVGMVLGPLLLPVNRKMTARIGCQGIIMLNEVIGCIKNIFFLCFQ